MSQTDTNEQPESDSGVNAESQTGAAEAPVNAELEQMTRDLAAARKRVDELARALQALDRDREEFKARINRERERMLDVEKGNVAVALLEAVDDLDLSLKAGSDDSPLAQGVRLIRDNLLKRLELTGIERVALAGLPYDPNLAEAFDMELTDQPDDDQRVISELRPAYRLKGKVIRPGRVKVAKYVKPAEA